MLAVMAIAHRQQVVRFDVRQLKQKKTHEPETFAIRLGLLLWI
jgi:hypothetical protein